MNLCTFKVQSKSNEMHVAFVRGDDGEIVLLAWCKSPARIDYAARLAPFGEGIASAPLTLERAEAIIAQATAQRRGG